MKITEVTDTPDDMCSGDYHILTFAETGFAVLSTGLGNHRTILGTG
jgi:hypothetical protein